MSDKVYVCTVCAERPTSGELCAQCRRSHDEVAMRDMSHANLIRWAARRARMFERRRARKAARALAETLDHVFSAGRTID